MCVFLSLLIPVLHISDIVSRFYVDSLAHLYNDEPVSFIVLLPLGADSGNGPREGCTRRHHGYRAG